MKRILKEFIGVSGLKAVGYALTAVSFVQVAAMIAPTVAPHLTSLGTLSMAAAIAIAAAYDTVWAAMLHATGRAIAQRNTRAAYSFGAATAAVVVLSAVMLARVGHAGPWSALPACAALLLGADIYRSRALADTATAAQITALADDGRNALALAHARARRRADEAATTVVEQMAEGLADIERRVTEVDLAATSQARIMRAQAKAEERLKNATKKHGKRAAAFAARQAEQTRTGAVPPGVPDVPQVNSPNTAYVPPGVPGAVPPVPPVPPRDPGVTLEGLAAVAGVDTPLPGVQLTDEQIDVVIRWLRHGEDPPRSYRVSTDLFRERGFQGSQERVRKACARVEAEEKQLQTRPQGTDGEETEKAEEAEEAEDPEGAR